MYTREKWMEEMERNSICKPFDQYFMKLCMCMCGFSLFAKEGKLRKIRILRCAIIFASSMRSKFVPLKRLRWMKCNFCFSLRKCSSFSSYFLSQRIEECESVDTRRRKYGFVMNENAWTFTKHFYRSIWR